MTKFLSKLFGAFSAFVKFCGKHQMGLQSTVLWIVALFNFGSDHFWAFAIPAILISGIGELINELRKLNTQNTDGKS